MRKYKYKGKYIDVKKFGYYIAKKLKWIIALTVVVAIIAIVVIYAKNVADKKKHDKKYPDNVVEKSISLKDEDVAKAQQYYETLVKLDSCRDYIDNAPYMKIDYNKVSLRTMQYFVTDSNNQPSYWNVQEIVTAINDDSTTMDIANKLGLKEMNESYIKDMIKIDTSQSGILKVFISAFDSNYTNEIGNAIKNAIFAYKKENLIVSEIVDGTTITRDTNIRDIQQSYINNEGALVATLERLDEELSGKQSKYIDKYRKAVANGEEISFGEKIKYTKKSIATINKKECIKRGLAVGGATGLLLFLATFLVYIITPFIWSGKNIYDTWGVEYLGRINIKGKRDDRNNLEFMLNDSGEKYVVISSCLDAASVLEFIDIEDCVSIDELIAGDKKLAKDSKIILAEKAGKKTYANMERELQLLKKYEENIQGYIAIE